MESVQIRTAQNVGIDFEVAGLGDRIIAALIDYFLITCYLLSFVLLNEAVGSTAFFLAAGVLPYLLYFLLCEIFLDGQSLGKRMRNIKVARLDGTPPGLGDYLLRWLLRLVELDMTFGLVAFITVLVTGKGQRLGDLAAGTTVVALKPRVHLRDTLLAEVGADYTPHFPAAEALSTEDITTAKEVLHTMTSAARSPAASRVGHKMKATLEEKMQVRSDLPPVRFLQTVVRDYNHLKGRL